MIPNINAPEAYRAAAEAAFARAQGASAEAEAAFARASEARSAAQAAQAEREAALEHARAEAAEAAARHPGALSEAETDAGYRQWAAIQARERGAALVRDAEAAEAAASEAYGAARTAEAQAQRDLHVAELALARDDLLAEWSAAAEALTALAKRTRAHNAAAAQFGEELWRVAGQAAIANAGRHGARALLALPGETLLCARQAPASAHAAGFILRPALDLTEATPFGDVEQAVWHDIGSAIARGVVSF